MEELPIVSEDDVSDIDTTTTIEDTDENATAPGEVENITDKEHNYLHADLDISHTEHLRREISHVTVRTAGVTVKVVIVHLH